nr:glycosyltransferase family 61 protein [Pedobacter panaciterrae]
MKPSTLSNTIKELRKKPLNLQDKDVKLFQQAFSIDIKQPILQQLDDITILKDVIFQLKNFKFYPTFTHIQKKSKTYLTKRLRWLIRGSEHINKGLWITDEWSSEYFHWITDALPRLITIAQSELFNKEYHVILPLFFKTRPYVQQSLDLLGYKAIYYGPKKRLKVSKLLTITHTAPTGNYNSEIINNLRESFIKNLQLNPDRLIYISRAKANRRKIINENEVIDLLKKYNYEIHCFEDYDFNEQVAIMSQAKSLIGLHGAGLTNMLFMQRGAHVLEFRNENDSQNNCFYALASALDHNYYYLLNKGDKEDTFDVNINVNIEQLKETIEMYLSS